MELPIGQSRVHERCFHPSGQFIPFDSAATEGSIGCRFEAQVALYGGHTAIRDETGSVTYDELNRRANRLARALAAQPDPGAPVGLLIESVIAMVSAMLGALKAGRIFVPLDPSDPVERTRHILADSGASCLVSETLHARLAASLRPPSATCLDVADLDSGFSDANFDLELPPDTGAYIIYTSGSTGLPKGVLHTHRTLLHNVRNYTDQLRVCAADRMGSIHSFAFSSSMVEIFPALLNGASLHRWNFRAFGFRGLAEWFQSEGITLFIWIPTPFRQFAQTVRQDAPIASLRVLMLGSEAVSVKDLRECRRLFGDGCLFVNRLGATETGNYRLFFADARSRLEGQGIPAGYAAPDTELLLLDERGAVLPPVPGQPGVIAVHSPALSPGYWNKPELTAKVFVLDPRGGSRRFYVTGDLGSLDADGCLHFHGRNDFQVKIRGFRVELTAIEGALLRDPRLSQAVVAARGDSGETQRLVAYLVVAPGASAPSVAELRAMLALGLPDYMVPWTYVFLDRIPTTPSGKVDRKSLPPPPDDTREPVALTPSEAKLAAIWERVLKRGAVGPHDNFFELGGDSLTAATLLLYLEESYGRPIPPAILVANPTIARLAPVLERAEAAGAWSLLVPIRREGSLPPFFFVHAHTTSVFAFVRLSRHLGPDQPFYAFQGHGLDSLDSLTDDFAEMARQYVAEMRMVQPFGPYWLGGFCFGGSLALEMARQLRAAGQQVGLVVTVQGRSHDYPLPKPWARGPVWLACRAWRRLESELAVFREQTGPEAARHFASRTRRLADIALAGCQSALNRLLSPFGLKLPPTRASKRMAYESMNIAAFRRHRFAEYGGDVLVIHAEKQPLGIVPDPTLGWKNLVRGQIDTAAIPGGQLGILWEPRVRLVAEIMADRLRAKRGCY